MLFTWFCKTTRVITLVAIYLASTLAKWSALKRTIFASCGGVKEKLAEDYNTGKVQVGRTSKLYLSRVV